MQASKSIMHGTLRPGLPIFRQVTAEFVNSGDSGLLVTRVVGEEWRNMSTSLLQAKISNE